MKLDIKYRPNTFDEMIGQQSTIAVLKASIIQNKISSAYLFSGPSGTGKTTAGRIFSKAILCESPIEGNPCGVCESCKMFAEGKHFGYRELDSASAGDKDNMVKLKSEAASLSVSKKKIILLDECHDISGPGQDTLLDQTEKCPEHLVYIFCTTDPDKMKKTLKNRCIHFQVSRIDYNLIQEKLKEICQKEGLDYEPEALASIAYRSKGQVRNAIKLMEEISYLGNIDMKNLNTLSKDYETEIFDIVSNLGIDLKKVVDSYKVISSYISSIDFYEALLQMISDASKLICGYDDFPEKRKSLLSRLKDIHGYSLLEFLNYLITRDKYIDKLGLQSDLIVLHYKFCSNAFVPLEQKAISKTEERPSKKEEIKEDLSPKVVTFADLSKLGIPDRSRVLREQKAAQKLEKEEKQTENIVEKWPLPKEERRGMNSKNDDILSPEEFSRRLIGGIGDGLYKKPLVDSGVE